MEDFENFVTEETLEGEVDIEETADEFGEVEAAEEEDDDMIEDTFDDVDDF